MKTNLKLAFITMQKNEQKLIDIFVEHHSHLASFQDIYILDNGSTDKAVLNKLKELRSKGVNVNFEFNKKSDFENKGNVILNLIKTLDLPSKYDFIVPMDTDELFCLENNGNFYLDREHIHNYLAKLPATELGYRVYHCLNNMTMRENLFKKVPQKKVFFANHTSLQKLDIGFHQFGKDDLFVPTSIVYLHFHNRYYLDTLRSAREKMLLRVKDFSVATLSEYKKKSRPGWHLVKYYLQSTKEYYAIKMNDSKGEVVNVNLSGYLKNKSIQYPYLAKEADDKRKIFWAKNPTNLAFVKKKYIDFTGIINQQDALLFSFGKSIDGFVDGYVPFNTDNGYGWIGALPKFRRQRDIDHQILGTFALGLMEKCEFRIVVPDDNYRIRIICHDTLFDNHIFKVSINSSDYHNVAPKKGEYCEIEYNLKVSDGLVNVLFESEKKNIIVNAIVIEPILSNEIKSSQKYKTIPLIKANEHFNTEVQFDEEKERINSLVQVDACSSKQINVDYLKIIKSVVDFYLKQQDDNGAILDKILGYEYQYATPSFAFAAGLCSKFDKKYLKPAKLALLYSVQQLVSRNVANKHEDFFPYLIAKAYICLENNLDDTEKKLISDKINSFIPYSIYRSPIGGSEKSGQNWNMIASAGESFFSNLFGKDDHGFIRNSLALQSRNFKGKYGLYAEGPVTYDIKPRTLWTDALISGYEGDFSEEMWKIIRQGAITSLIIQSPDGSLPPGGRSSNHTWGDALQCSLFEMMSSVYAKEGNFKMQELFASAAALAFSSVKRNLAKSGDLFVVKNRAKPEIRNGFESYTSCSHYNLFAAANLANAYLYANKRNRDTKTFNSLPPAHSEKCFNDLSSELGRVIANFQGTQLVVDLGLNHKQNATGIIRVMWPSNGNDICGIPDGTLKNASYNQLGETLTSSIGIGFIKSGKKLKYLSDMSNNEFKSIDVSEPTITEFLLSFNITYTTKENIEIKEYITLGKDKITLNYSLVGNIEELRFRLPILASDGENEKIASIISPYKYEISSESDSYCIETEGSSPLELSDKIYSHRSGAARIVEAKILNVKHFQASLSKSSRELSL